MPYSFLADLVLLLHLAFILFVTLGGLAVANHPRLAWLHVPAVTWGAAVELMGWYCPLTHLEDYLRSLYGAPPAYSTAFIARGLETLVYPDIPEKSLRAGEILLTALYLLAYGHWAKKRGWWGRIRKLFHET